jgi:hypothetical protein
VPTACDGNGDKSADLGKTCPSWLASYGRLVLLILLTSTMVVGCYTERWVDFNLIKGDEPVTMLERYSLEFKGYASSRTELIINVSFLEAIVDTNSVDTIPVFMIDSVCFSGSCLDSSYCGHPINWQEFNEWLKAQHGPEFGYSHGIPVRKWDLWYDDGRLIPTGYDLLGEETPPIPANCLDTTLSVETRARLLDPVSRKEIARESKTLTFRVTPREAHLLLSGVSDQNPYRSCTVSGAPHFGWERETHLKGGPPGRDDNHKVRLNCICNVLKLSVHMNCHTGEGRNPEISFPAKAVWP